MSSSSVSWWLDVSRSGANRPASPGGNARVMPSRGLAPRETLGEIFTVRKSRGVAGTLPRSLTTFDHHVILSPIATAAFPLEERPGGDPSCGHLLHEAGQRKTSTLLGTDQPRFAGAHEAAVPSRHPRLRRPH